MVNVTTSDILTEERIRRVIEEEREHALIWDDLYRSISMPEGSPDTMHIPLDEGVMGEPGRVMEASEFPRNEEEYDTVPVTVQKYGFEIAISDESQMYSIFDVVTQQLDKAARRMSEMINRLAFEELDANLHPNTNDHTGQGAFGYPQIVDANKEMKDSQLDPDRLIVNTAGEAELLKSDEFQRASDLGDQTTVSGMIGRIAGLDVFVDNSGLMDADNPEGYVVDPTEYGYSIVREQVATNDYRADEIQSDIWQIFTFRTWKAIEPEAALKVSE